MSESEPVVALCPRCGTSVSKQTGGVCLVCLGEEALRLAGMDDPAGSTIHPPAPATTHGANAARSPRTERSLPRHLGAYEIIEEVGRGGMGVVYAARHRSLERIVALKVITGGRFATVDQETRFIREAQTAGRLRHPHIVPVLDAGHDAGVAFYTMDLVPDGDLAERLHAARMAPRDAALLMRKIADAVGYAHREGVLHRDLKPSNILLEGDEPRVADFGLAAQLEPGAELTRATRVLGTPGYLAPEVYLQGSKAASPASDVYALGSIFYEMLTGRPPFLGEPAPPLTRREPVAPRLLAPAVSRDLETIALKCLEPSPATRYADASELAADLQRLLEGHPIIARPVSTLGRFTRWCRRQPALAAVWFLVVALAAGAIASAGVIARARDRAVLAEHDAREQLWSAKLAEAEARGLTRRTGRRAAALEALKTAAAIRPSRELRNTAIATLALTDLEIAQRWPIAAEGVLHSWFDPAGRTCVIDMSGPITWREVGTDRVIAQLGPGDGTLLCVGFPVISADSSRLAMRMSDDTVHVWQRDSASAKIAWTLPSRPHPWPESNPLYGADLAFSPNGETLVVSAPDGGFTLHAADDGRALGRWSDPWPITRARFSPDGQLIAATCARKEAHGQLHIIDATALQTLRTIEAGGNVFDASWSITGRLLAAGTDALEVRVFRVDDGKLVQTLPVRDGNPARVAFLGSDENVLTATIEAAFRWRSLHSGEEFLRVEGVELGGFSPTADGQSFFTTDQSALGFQYRVVPPAGVRVQRVEPDKYSTSTAGTGGLGFSPDGHWFFATADGELILFRTSDGTRVAKFATADSGEDVTAAFAQDGAALFICGTHTGLQRVPFVKDKDAYAFGTAESIDTAKGFLLRDVSDDGRRLALAAHEAGRVKVIDVTDSQPHLLAEWDAPGAYGIAFGPHGDELLINHDDSAPGAEKATVRAWDAATGRIVSDLGVRASGDVDWCERAGLALTSNGANIAYLWRKNGAAWVRAIQLPAAISGNASSFTLAPDGQTAAIGIQSGVHLIDTAKGAEFAMLNAETAIGFAEALAFSPDGQHLAALNADGVVFLWDLPALRRELAKLALDW